MRKTISHHVTNTDFTTDAAKMKVTIHPTGALAQNVNVGDTIEINGTVTAGNSSGINDGAAALLLTTLEAVSYTHLTLPTKA